PVDPESDIEYLPEPEGEYIPDGETIELRRA
ncbi:hypothetical protein Trydic_g378, partial [Trypoxylus dichotomus]